MNKNDIIKFFNEYAPTWDENMVCNDEIIAIILENAHIKDGVKVLDVACGTGVLFPYYFDCNVESITGIDISPKMIEIAASKYSDTKILKIICGDVETHTFDDKFDVIMVYNAFPHFPEPKRLIDVLADLLKPKGVLSIAHSMSREALLKHHSGAASKVSIDLLHENVLADLMTPYFNIETIISNDEMYQVVGIRK